MTLQQQYEQIHKTIRSNISTIKELFEEARALTEIVESINGAENTELKEKLEERIKAIHKSLVELVNHTSKLFDLYEQFSTKVSKRSAEICSV